MNQSLFLQSMGGFIHPLLLMWPFSQLPTKIKEKTLNSLVKHHQPETAVWDNVSVLPSLCMISLTTDTSIMHDGANPGQRQLISSWKFGVSQPFSNVLPNVLNVFHHVNIPVSNPPPLKKSIVLPLLWNNVNGQRPLMYFNYTCVLLSVFMISSQDQRCTDDLLIYLFINK